jgi:orotidine-5'-phosphate decarboxylase
MFMDSENFASSFDTDGPVTLDEIRRLLTQLEETGADVKMLARTRAQETEALIDGYIGQWQAYVDHLSQRLQTHGLDGAPLPVGPAPSDG